MKLLLLSCALILVVLSLSAPSLSANGNESVTPPKSQHTSKRQKPQTETNKKESKQNPIPIKILESDYLNKTAKQDEDNKQANLEIQRKLRNYTLALAILAAFQIAVLVAQVIYNRALTINQHVIERAYVHITYSSPGLIKPQSPSSDPYRIIIVINNLGQTPTMVTDITFTYEVLASREYLSPKPKYREGEPRRQFFLYRSDGVVNKGTTMERHIPVSNEQWDAIESRQKILFVYGYADYIDQFRQRHRAGYGWQYGPDDTPINLAFIPFASYNYDRPRDKSEGNDWEPA